MKKNSNISGFSIIEVMIAIFIFTMWMASIFMVISASMNIDNLNKNQIIASNLAREEIEIIRNIRDSNYETYHKWNWIPNSSYDYSKIFEIGKYYKLENDYNDVDYSFKIDEITDFQEWKDKLADMSYKLYLNSDNHYTYDSTGIWTVFYRYLYIEELKDPTGSIIDDAIKVKSKVIWYSKWYHEFEINTILTDFNRL